MKSHNRLWHTACDSKGQNEAKGFKNKKQKTLQENKKMKNLKNIVVTLTLTATLGLGATAANAGM